MLKACLKQKELYYNFKLDMYKDGLSLPGLSKNILFQFSQQGFSEYQNKNLMSILTGIPIPKISMKRFKVINNKIEKLIDLYQTTSQTKKF
jgi:hypothetical protein